MVVNTWTLENIAEPLGSDYEAPAGPFPSRYNSKSCMSNTLARERERGRKRERRVEEQEKSIEKKRGRGVKGKKQEVTVMEERIVAGISRGKKYRQGLLVLAR